MNGRSSRWIAAVLWVFAAMYLANGIEMFFFPATWFYRLVPGVPETGAFNAHLVADSGTFFIGIGAALVFSALDPHRHAVAVVAAAVSSLMHAILHIYSHEAGLLSYEHMITETAGIYVPTLALCALAFVLMRPIRESGRTALRAA